MTRRLIWSLVLGSAVLVFIGLWAMQHLERVPFKQREAPAREARRNPYLALERFLARMQRPLQRASDPRRLDALPTPGVLILDRNRARHVDAARAQQLLDWVSQGGYLILVPEMGATPDPLRERLDLEWANPRQHDDGDDGDEQDAAETPAQPAPRPPAQRRLARPPEHIAVRIPATANALDAAFAPGLEPGDMAPQWQAGSEPYGNSLVHFKLGQGNLTVIARLDTIASNEAIGQRDHAELIWTLLQRYQPQGPVLLLTRLHMPTLWEWLAESAWMVLVSAAALIVVWLWRIVPRFGVPRAQVQPEHRALREQLGAIGRYVWRAGGLNHWLEVSRRAFRARLALKHPALANLPPKDLTRALAQLTQRPHESIAVALEQDARTPLQFTEALRMLQRLERSLQ